MVFSLALLQFISAPFYPLIYFMSRHCFECDIFKQHAIFNAYLILSAIASSIISGCGDGTSIQPSFVRVSCRLGAHIIYAVGIRTLTGLLKLASRASGCVAFEIHQWLIIRQWLIPRMYTAGG